MANQIQLKFNDQAPDIELFDVDGKPVHISNFWKDSVLVLAFTRHFGCPQCKEMVDQLVEAYPSMLQKGLKLVLVTHATPEAAKKFSEQRAPGVVCLADPERKAYHAYGLFQGTLWQTLLSPRIWSSNRRLAKTKGYTPEVPPAGQDAYQMSGTFIIGTDGRIRLPYYYEDIADHPPVDLILHGVMGADWNRPIDIKP
ncbi:MAG: peroxiredoxin-like family protein [Anaerolineales bacterium]